MKRFIGKLPVNVKYEVVEISYKEKDAIDFSTCDNCGKIISNIAIIQNEQKQKYNVGLDCAATMQLYQANEMFDIIQAKKDLARRAQFVKWTKKNEITALMPKEALTNDKMFIFFYEQPNIKKWSSFWKYRMGYGYFKKLYSNLKLDIIIES